MSSQAAVEEEGRQAHPTSKLRAGLSSFRAKFILVVGAAVLFDLLLGGSIALWNVHRLSEGAADEVSRGLSAASSEYLRNYIQTTAERADLFFDQVHAEVNVLAGSMQTLIDHPAVADSIGNAVAADPSLSSRLDYNPTSNWWQNLPGEPSAVTVWGYLLDEKRQVPPKVAADVRNSAALNIFGPAIEQSGTDKLQIYYMGPKADPFLRSTPYSDQGSTFDKVYPGHNQNNWWDFFFPGLYEDWQAWIRDPLLKPVPDETTTLSPYPDGVTGKIIVSFVRPLRNKDGTDVDGAVGADLSLDQMAAVVQNIRIADTGFAFLAMSNGNVLAISPEGEKTLGIGNSKPGAFDRSLKKSAQSAIAAMDVPVTSGTVTRHVELIENGLAEPYIVMFRALKPTNMWAGQGPITREIMTIGFVVSEREIYASLTATKNDIARSTANIIRWQIASVVLSMLIVLFAIFGISKRITAGLTELAAAARRLQNKDYSVRVTMPARDEVGQVGIAFNRMAEEIRYHTENLESLVKDRTRELALANNEISALNEKLKGENLRLGAELDVARRIQMMILPKPGELSAIPNLEIATLMLPAEEVGGDYYDVLQVGNRIKIGIGDVTGHGLESGVLMLMVQSVARALQEQGETDPKRFLEVLNRAIFKNVQRTESDKYLSLAFVDYDGETVTLTGQHEEVVIIRPDGAVERIDTESLGFPIGLEFEIGAFIGTKELTFGSGDIMILHTDGVTEAESPSGELFGFDRLIASAVAHRHGDADAMLRAVMADLMAHIGTQKIHDDITFIVLRHR